MTGQIIEFFERKQAHMMPNIILMQIENRGQKQIIGGFSSHGWLRDSSITQNINGMDLTMRFGGDETCFLFNLTQNLRFDTLRGADSGDIPVYTSTSLIRDGDDMEAEDDDEEEESHIDENDDDESQGSEVGFGKMYKAKMKKRKQSTDFNNANF